jgi:hypothetical protein
MHTSNRLLPTTLLLLAGAAAAQTTVPFPAEYSAVAEGPLNAPNLPLANGVSRTLVVYERVDLAIPANATVTHLGFRQDGTLTQMDAGRALQLEIRVGYTTRTAATLSTTFDSNFAAAPTTVFGPGLFQLPNLRDAANPLPGGAFFIPLATPFVFAPAADQNLLVEYRVLGTSSGGAAFTYRLDRADFFSPVALGPAGCAHSGGTTPTLAVTPVRIGSSLTVTLANAPANSFAFVAVQLGGQLVAPFALDALIPGIAAACRGQVAPGALTTLSGVTSSAGGLSLSYAIPNSPSLNDLTLPHQAVLFDFFAPGGLVVSNGAQVQVGIRPRTSVVSAQGPANVATGTLQTNYCPVAFFRYQ